MKLSIKKESIIIFSFILMCISVFFLRWYIDSNLIAYVAFLSSAFLFIFFEKKEKLDIKKIVPLMLIIIYIFINILLTQSHPYLFDDLFVHTILPFSILFFFTKYFNSEKIIEKIKKSLFYIFNIYYVCNTFIVLKQIAVKGFMVRNFSNNTFYPDQIDGLFGTNGTHRLCMFFLICIYMNIINFSSENKTRNKISKLMFIFVLVTSLYISAFNDNRMYYLLLVVFLLPVVINKIKIKKEINKKTIMKTLIIVTSIGTIFGITYKYNEKFKNFVKVDIYEKNIQKTINRANNTRTDSSEKGEERLDLTIYALKNGNGYLIGKGIGSIVLYGDSNLPKHFGLCETTTRIYTGGIIYLLLIAFVYTMYLSNYVKRKNTIIFTYFFGTIIMFSIYARIFTLFDETFLISLLYLFLATYLNNSQERGKL